MTLAVEPTRLAREQIEEASAVVARAFHDDSLATWLLPDGSRRLRVQAWMSAATLRYAIRHGEVYTTAGGVKGVAVWMPPGGYPMSLPRLLLAGWIAAPLKMGLPTLRRFLASSGFYERLHNRDAGPPHWYLLTLGVDPPHQGRGIGSALIRPVLARADAEGIPCYLETEKERNVHFYRRHGFEVAAEGSLPGGGPRFWTMQRSPRG